MPRDFCEMRVVNASRVKSDLYLGTVYDCLMGGSPPPKNTTPPEHPALDADEPRPTVVPEFDPAAFARDSELRQRAAAPVAPSGESTIDEARLLRDRGEHERALLLLEQLLELAPLHPEATQLAAECRTALERECLSALGSERAILVAGVTTDELKSFKLDNVSAFLMSLVDGATRVESILDLAGVPRLVALRHLRNLLERGIVALASGSRSAPVSGSERPNDATPRREDDAVLESGVLEERVGMATLDAVPILLLTRDVLDTLDLDPTVRALVALIDDRSTVEEILAATNTDLVEGAFLFERLADDGIVTFL
jgi:hypothetical protein